MLRRQRNHSYKKELLKNSQKLNLFLTTRGCSRENNTGRNYVQFLIFLKAIYHGVQYFNESEFMKIITTVDENNQSFWKLFFGSENSYRSLRFKP